MRREGGRTDKLYIYCIVHGLHGWLAAAPGHLQSQLWKVQNSCLHSGKDAVRSKHLELSRDSHPSLYHEASGMAMEG